MYFTRPVSEAGGCVAVGFDHHNSNMWDPLFTLSYYSVRNMAAYKNQLEVSMMPNINVRDFCEYISFGLYLSVSRSAPSLSLAWTFLYLLFFRLVTWFGLPQPTPFANAIQLLLTLKVPHYWDAVFYGLIIEYNNKCLTVFLIHRWSV